MHPTNEPSWVEIELNPREVRLYDRLRASVVSSQPGVASTLRDLLLLLPDLVVLLLRLMRDSRVPTGAKLIAAGGVAYILSPIDLVPEVLFGPIGLIDDLLIVGTALSRLMKSVHPDVVRHHWSGKGDALEMVGRVTSWTDVQLTQRIPAVLGRVFRTNRA